jgi:hypothetical protein
MTYSPCSTGTHTVTSTDVNVGMAALAPGRTALDLTTDKAPEASPIQRRIPALRHRPWWTPSTVRSFRGWTRGLACLTGVVGMLIAGIASPASAGATISPGYTLSNVHIIGESPTGFRVYVSPSATHHKSMSVYTSGISAQLHSFGLPVKYAGYGNPVKVRGIITVSESSRGCTGSTSTLANTFWYYAGMPGGYYMYRSDIVICAARYAHLSGPQRAAVLRHEFGHTMGLGHTNYVYRGSYQVMNAYLHSGVGDYRSGDIVGLKHLAAGTAIVRSRVS